MIRESERFLNRKVDSQKAEIERSFGIQIEGFKIIKRAVNSKIERLLTKKWTQKWYL